tara:strand:+ start:187 stop:591 length:405 start_codon:yes stop_codon:yes gene_type:complete
MFNQWRQFLLDENLTNKEIITEISEKKMSLDYDEAIGFIKLSLITPEAADRMINLLLLNINSYLDYLEMSTDDESLFKLKKSFKKNQSEPITDDNIESLIKNTENCLKIVIESYPSKEAIIKKRIKDRIEGNNK